MSKSGTKVKFNNILGCEAMNEKLKNVFITAATPIVVYLIFYALQPNRFGNLNGLYIMFQQAFIPSIMGWGLYFVLTLGLYDFSVGAVLVLAGIVGGNIGAQFGYAGMFIGAILVSMLLGFVNGIAHIKLKIPSLIVTIGLLMIYETFGMFFKGGNGIILPDHLRMFGKAPYNIIAGLIVMAIAYLLFTYSRKGIHIRAVGSNEMMAKNMGIKTGQTKVLGFVISGFFVGIAAVLTLSYSGMMIPQTGMTSMLRIFTPLMGCFLGIAFKKYCNPIISILIGEFILIMIMTGLMTVGVDATIQQVITGLFLLLVVGITMRQKSEAVVK
jgi:ribose transport system permease protein